MNGNFELKLSLAAQLVLLAAVVVTLGLAAIAAFEIWKLLHRKKSRDKTERDRP